MSEFLSFNDWYPAICEKLNLLYDRLKSEVLKKDYIQVDDSTLPVIDNEKHRAVDGYMWCTIVTPYVLWLSFEPDDFLKQSDDSLSRNRHRYLLSHCSAVEVIQYVHETKLTPAFEIVAIASQTLR